MSVPIRPILVAMMVLVTIACQPTSLNGSPPASATPPPGATETDAPTPSDSRGASETPSSQEISWEAAVEHINAGRVTQIFQTHSLQVTLYLEDGRQLVTMEPGIDAVFGVVERCGELCEGIMLATE
jgi:hypothetical protein